MRARIPQEERKAIPLISVHQSIGSKAAGSGREEEDGQESPQFCFSFVSLWFSILPLLQGQPQSPGLWLIQVISHLLGGMVETRLEPRLTGIITREEQRGEGGGVVSGADSSTLQEAAALA